MTQDSLIYSQLEAEAKSENTSGDRLWELARKDDNLALIVAQNTVAPEKVLKELSKSNNSAIRKAVCANPNTASNTLWQLASEFPQQLLNNPIFELLVLENPNFIENIPINIFRQLLDLSEFPEHFRELASNSHQDNIRVAIAENSRTSADMLNKLADDQSFYVRTAVAGNPNTSVDDLHKLAGDQDEDVLDAVTSNPNTSADDLHKVVDMIHKLAVNNPNYF
ncbi:MAG: hypothetical protein ACRC80_36820 [Waterburya sp.]